MNTLKKFSVTILITFGLFVPVFVFADTSLVPCDGVTVKCDFNQIWLLVDNVIDFAFKLILPIAAIIFAYVGWLFLSSGGSTETRKKAKGIFVKVVIGILIILAAWLIVNTVLDALGVSSAFRIIHSN